MEVIGMEEIQIRLHLILANVNIHHLTRMEVRVSPVNVTSMRGQYNATDL